MFPFDFLQRQRRKIKAICGILKSKDIAKMFRIAPENEARAIVESVLMKQLKPSTEQHANVLRATADQIIAKILIPPKSSMSERIEELMDGNFRQAFWFHSQLSGLTATWEFKVRFLGIKLGVRPNVPISKKSKENRSKKSVEHRSLSETIKEINRLTKQNLGLKLVELAGLRDAIVHCNPQGMKAYATPLFGKEKMKNVRGNVVVIALPGDSIKNLSDLKEEDEIEGQDLFGWFLETFNSELPKKAFDLFDQSIRAIDLLVTFAAISEDKMLRPVFEKIVFNGIAPTKNEIALFHSYFSKDYSLVKMSGEDFFVEIGQSFRSLNERA